jgi:hypothetical protein
LAIEGYKTKTKTSRLSLLEAFNVDGQDTPKECPKDDENHNKRRLNF